MRPWFRLTLSWLLFFSSDPLLCEPLPLSARNTEAPFAYLRGGERRWPVLRETLPEGSQIEFSILKENSTATGIGSLNAFGLSISLAEEGHLRIASATDSGAEKVDLKLRLTLPGGATQEQTLDIRPAPPNRPISYYADFGDDIIRIYMDSQTGDFKPIEIDGLDQYFRRLQAQGISRLIVWLSPFPYTADPAAYDPEDWRRYEAQARAILESDELTAAFLAGKQEVPESQWGRYTPYGQIRQLLALRLMPDFGEMLSKSAEEHGIRLTLSYRPFEAALTKYYEIPAFDSDGTFLWGFLPMASPTVNYRTNEVCFAHYRTLLREASRENMATLNTIEVPGVENAEAFLKTYRESGNNLSVVASMFPPVQEDSFVLVRGEEGTFGLRRYGEIKENAENGRLTITGFDVELSESGSVLLSGLEVPEEYRYLILSATAASAEALDFPTFEPVRLHAKAGNRLGRENVYWVLNASTEFHEKTRVAGIRSDGVQYSEFDATQASWKALAKGPARKSLTEDFLVIDRGAPWSVETIDFNREKARANALAEIRALLSYPAFDEIFINTRSHTQLPAYQGDGEHGIRPIVEYRNEGTSFAHLGIDRAYAPLSVARDPAFASAVADVSSVQMVTTWNPGAWGRDCQKPDCPHFWRAARNRAVATGVRQLLLDLEGAFPETRIRAVIPPSELVVDSVKEKLETLNRPDGTPYGSGYYGTIGSTINHIRSIGEGMAVVDLSGTKIEPVFFGIRSLIDPAPLDLYVRSCIRGLKENRGSSYRGPKSFFYEAQETMRATAPADARERRERTICSLLSHEEEINEVILYEAADWTYFLSFSDPDYSGHGYIDRCPKTTVAPVGGPNGG